jgi:hypothetical protein
MGVVQLPAWRLRSQGPDRAALRQGIAASSARMRVVSPDGLRLINYCERCAAPIDEGAVMRGASVYCSVECSFAWTWPKRLRR